MFYGQFDVTSESCVVKYWPAVLFTDYSNSQFVRFFSTAH